MLPVGGGQDGRVRFLFSLNCAAAVHGQVLLFAPTMTGFCHTKAFSGNLIQLQVTMAWIFLLKPGDWPLKTEMEPL